MTAFRMKHAVNQLAAAADSNSHPGSDGDINYIFQSSGTAIGHLAQTGAVYIRIQPNGNCKFPLQLTQKIAVAPWDLWGV